MPHAIKSAFFVDTNNTALKVANTVVDLNKVKADGEICGVRPGMSMEEVVGRWGKPVFMWSRCYGGPRFAFKDVDIVFEPNSNSVKLIFMNIDRVFRFENGLNPWSSTNDLIQVLGAPTRRTKSIFGFQFIYEIPRGILDLEFDPESEYFPGYTQLKKIRIMATENRTEPIKQK